MIQIEWQRALIEISESENLLEAFDFLAKAVHRKINELEEIKARYETLKKAWGNYSIPQQETVDRWIPVTERLPEDDDPVMITTCADTLMIACFYSYFWESEECHLDLDEVKAWMELPKPYKERG